MRMKNILHDMFYMPDSELTWCTIPEPGGTTSILRKAVDPHLRKENLSLFLWNSSSILACTAFSDLATSTWTEWSTTRSTGTWQQVLVSLRATYTKEDANLENIQHNYIKKKERNNIQIFSIWFTRAFL